MQNAPQFDVSTWPQFSLYNLIVANFWPMYWVAHFVDPVKVDEAYWHVYTVTEARAAAVIRIVELLVTLGPATA